MRLYFVGFLLKLAFRWECGFLLIGGLLGNLGYVSLISWVDGVL